MRFFYCRRKCWSFINQILILLQNTLSIRIKEGMQWPREGPRHYIDIDALWRISLPGFAAGPIEGD